MEVNDFEIFLMDVTFYVQKLVVNVLIKMKTEYNQDQRLKG